MAFKAMRLSLSRFKSTNTPLFALLALLAVLLVASLNDLPTPKIDTEFEGATIHITADRGWSLTPFDCIELRWQLEGIDSVYINDVGKSSWGEMIYCPPWDGSGPDFRITAQNGAVDTFTLDLSFGPDELLNCLLFVTILTLFLLAGYFLLRYRLDQPLPLTWSSLILFAIVVVACLLGTASGVISIPQILQDTGQVFGTPAWQFIGLILGALVFIPLLIQKLRRGIKTNSTVDFLAVAAFFLFVLLLYLPFGFESIGHWEEWVFRAYLEGRPSKLGHELVSRFWILVPPQLAMVFSPDSFAGFHLVNLLMFWGTMALLYGVLRQLKFSHFVAFLCSVLFLVYPVNSQLMSLRSLIMTFGKVSLLAGIYLVLDYRSNPSRLRLLGIWLALLFSIGSYEIGFAIILVIPLFWWRRPPFEWGKFNLTLAWYLFPAAKLVYHLLLMTDVGNFYRSYILGSLFESERSLLGQVGHYLGILGDVYRQTFFTGWREAISIFVQSTWIAHSVIALAVIVAVALYHGRDSEATPFPHPRHAAGAFIGGLLFILPSVGILLWLDGFNRDPWRMYIYVPIGAAVAIFGALLLVGYLVKNPRLQKAFLIAASLMLMIPATSRLFVQHAHFVNSANAKATVLRQVVEQAPAIDPDAYVILLTDMTGSELRSRFISEFRTNSLDSAIYVLYEDKGPQVTFLCRIDIRCHLDDVSLQRFNLNDVADFSNLVIFRLHEDLRVELLRELPPELGLDDRGSYKPDRLIDYAASLPPRAVTMLGAGQ